MRLHSVLLGLLVCVIPACVVNAAWELFEQTRVEGRLTGVTEKGSAIRMQSGSIYEVSEVTQQDETAETSKVTVMRDGSRFLVAIEGFSKALICKQIAPPRKDANHAEPRREPTIASPITDVPLEQIPFKDLGSVAVLVEGLKPEARKAGLSEELLKTAVELKLRQNAISVRDVDSYTSESPYVYVNLNAVFFDRSDSFAFSISVHLKQAVILPRNGERIQASTWNTGAAGIAPKYALREDAIAVIDTLMFTFCNNYVAANRQGAPDATIRTVPTAPRGPGVATSDRSGVSVGGRSRSREASPPPDVPQLAPRQIYSGLGEKHWVKEKIDRGAYILLDDGSLWEISRLDRIDTTLWLPMQDVIVVENRSGLLPYKLISEGDAVEAKLVGKR